MVIKLDIILYVYRENLKFKYQDVSLQENVNASRINSVAIMYRNKIKSDWTGDRGHLSWVSNTNSSYIPYMVECERAG